MKQTDYRSSQVSLGNSAPMTEEVGGAAGAGGQASRTDHRHPRLTAPHTGVLDANGRDTIIFERTFKNMPVVISSWVEANDNPPISFKVESWLKPDGTPWAAGSVYGGCVIRGYRGQKLPALTTVSGILTAVITGINAIVTALSGFNPFAGSPAGVTYMCLPVQVGDETSV